jgi:eukaryotic-like serine/threonine-protein kinase
MNIAQNVLIWALMYMGELGEVSRLVPPLLAHARRSGNLYIATELCTRSNYVWLAADNPDEGEREAIESIARWSHKGFHRQHYSALLARVQTALYRGDGDVAWRLFTAEERQVHRSLLTQFHVLRVEALYMRARSALAVAASRGGDARFLSIARASARRIANERAAWSDPIGMLVSAGIANVEGNRAVALPLLHEALGRFERADMNLYANVTKRRIGVLQQDAAGRELLGRANAWMAAQQIKNPMCMTRMLAPGFPDEA